MESFTVSERNFRRGGSTLDTPVVHDGDIGIRSSTNRSALAEKDKVLIGLATDSQQVGLVLKIVKEKPALRNSLKFPQNSLSPGLRILSAVVE